jgi:hypothetical protein
MAFTAFYLTQNGQQLITQAIASSGLINYTRVEYGSGYPASGDSPSNFTQLKNYVMDGTITGVNAEVLYQVTIRSNVQSKNAPFTFQVNEVGVFATLNNGPQTLVAYITTGAPNGDTINPTPAASNIVKDYAWLLPFSQAPNTTATVTLAQEVGLHAPSHLGQGAAVAGVDPIPNVSQANTGLVPFIPTPDPGSLSLFTDGTGNAFWSSAQLLLSSNLTLYVKTVANGGNDATAQPNDLTHPWATLQGAWNYLRKYVFAPGIAATISMGDGVYATASPGLSLDHVNGSQIQIIPTTAPTPIDMSFTNAAVVGGSAYLWSVQLTGLSSTAPLVVGNYLTVWQASGGTNSSGVLLTGCFKITAKTASTVTITVPYRTTIPALTGASGSLTPHNVVLPLAANQAITIGQHGVNTFQGIAVVAGVAPSAGAAFPLLSVLGSINIYRCGFSGNLPSAGYAGAGEYFGCYLSGGAGIIYKCGATGNMIGFTVVGRGTYNFIWCAGSNNSGYGLSLDNGTAYSLPDNVSSPTSGSALFYNCGNGSHGLFTANNSTLGCEGAWQTISGTLTAVGGSFLNYYNGGWGTDMLQSITAATFSYGSGQPNCTYINSNYNASGDLAVSSLAVANAPNIGGQVFNQARGTLTANGVING